MQPGQEQGAQPGIGDFFSKVVIGPLREARAGLQLAAERRSPFFAHLGGHQVEPAFTIFGDAGVDEGDVI